MAHVLSQSESTAGKVSSNTDHLFLVLKKTPVIQTIKALQPTTLLVVQIISRRSGSRVVCGRTKKSAG